MRIDSHQHFWRLARGDYGWLDLAPAALRRDFGPTDLEPLLDACDVQRSVLVQAAPTVSETEYLLEIAQRWPRAAGVVGWVDFTAHDVVQTIDRLRLSPGLLGLRPMLQDLPDAGWMLRDDVGRGLAHMARLEITFDALVKPRHLPSLLVLAQRHPGLRIVIDHAAKPDILGAALAAHGTRSVEHTPAWEAWAPHMLALAGHPNVHCKLSGLLTEAGHAWSSGLLEPFVRFVLEHFGPERVLWGSDWPVINAAGDYEGWSRVSRDLLAYLSTAQRQQVMGDNAAAVYGIMRN
jgi:L-fuconolactonase